MRVMLYSEDFTLSLNWQQKITLFKSEILEEIEDLHFYENGLIIVDYASCYKNLTKFITTLKIHKIKVLLLDSTPTFEKGKNVLSLGVEGYGNSLMSSTYLHSAIETIKDNMIWIYPKFTSALIQGFTKEQAIPEYIVQSITSRELAITLLIKEGLSNSDISERLEISINTVKSHIKSIFEKLNIKNRLSLSLLFRNH